VRSFVGRPGVYLDHAATVPLREEVRASMVETLGLSGNPSSVHTHGRNARAVVEEARASVARLGGVSADRVVFTSGATEANGTALRGFPDRPLLVSAIEHDSALVHAVPEARIPVDRRGLVDLDALEGRLARLDRPALVSVMLVNNETGVIQPIAAVAKLVHDAGGLLHVDAAQAPGRVSVSMDQLGADLLTLSAHKIGGPTGVGALLSGDGIEPRPLIAGGGQQRGRRAGTENVVGIVGFGRAAGLIDGAEDARLVPLREALEARSRAEWNDVLILGEGAPRVGAILSLAVPGVWAETAVAAMDLEGFSIGAGSACSSGRVRPSHVARAMGLDDEAAARVLRVSLGRTTTIEEVERFVETFVVWARRTRGGGRG